MLFHRTYPSQPSLCPSSKYIIGLFRSTVLRVMSPTRFLCATMMIFWYMPQAQAQAQALFQRIYLSHPSRCVHFRLSVYKLINLYTLKKICAPPSHKSVIDFTMSRSTISMTFLKFINPINHLNDFLPNGIYYHYSDICPLRLLQDFSFAHIHRL
jgi:hypothetical protein